MWLRRLDGDLQLKLVFSNHSVLYWTAAPYFHFSIHPVHRPKIKEIFLKIFNENNFLFVKEKIVEMMIVPHKAADFTFIRKLM